MHFYFFPDSPRCCIWPVAVLCGREKIAWTETSPPAVRKIPCVSIYRTQNSDYVVFVWEYWISVQHEDFNILQGNNNFIGCKNPFL